MRDKPQHLTEQIAPDTWRIEEDGAMNCYLLSGERCALLIDTCGGLGNLRKTVEGLTALPVDVLLTHRHCDHAGGTGWFESFHVHRADLAAIYRVMALRPAMRTIVSIQKQGCFVRAPFRPKAIGIGDGHVFDLGARMVKVLHIPGHTRGSIALLDEKTRLMITGDAVNPCLWMHLPGCTSLEAWLPGAERILALSQTYTAWCGHGSEPLTQASIAQTVELARELIAKARSGARLRGKIRYPNRDDFPYIVCRADRILG